MNTRWLHEAFSKFERGMSVLSPEAKKAIARDYDPDPEDQLGFKALTRFKRRITFIVYLALCIGIPWVLLHFIIKYW
ncbi:MAG: hypothetical protein DMG31_09455 [Acidobacteria bacterium]|nr:MAG: hypothetical protein DMG31_09455 [Acidobacteriota bacterium]